MSNPPPSTVSWYLPSLTSSSSSITPKPDTLDPWSPTDPIPASSSHPSVSIPVPVFGYPQSQPSMSELVHPLVGKSLGGGGGSGKGKEREKGMDLASPMIVAVLADVMDSSKGRDKVLKCAQYSLKTYLYLLSLVVRIRPLSPYFKSNRKRVGQAVSSLSLTRKCLLLLNPLHPLSHLLSPEPTSATTLLRHLLDLASALSDDLFCLSRLGLINRRLGKSADKWSNRFWFLTTIMGLYKLHLTTLPRLRSAAYHISEPENTTTIASRRALVDAEWTNRKLLADLIFVSYDVFNLSWFEEPIKCLAGLTAALISTTKIYDQHWRASLGKG